MWSSRNSILLSKLCIIIFFALLIAIAVTAPRLVSILMGASRSILFGKAWMFLVTIYCGCVPAFTMLISLYSLLDRIVMGDVFVERNVKSLRLISWCCFFGAVIAAVSALYYFPWLIVSAAAVFMALIIRVLKNVFSRAVSLQDDADFTI